MSRNVLVSGTLKHACQLDCWFTVAIIVLVSTTVSVVHHAQTHIMSASNLLAIVSFSFLADRTNGRGYATELYLYVCRLCL